MTNHDWELGGRLFLALLFGVIIGLERQWHHKTAGLKTNSLVTLGAAAFTLISQLGFANPAQIAAGVLTGVGFIGAGVIIRQGGSVQGINSAATLWVTAATGMMLSLGHYGYACWLLALVLLAQLLLRRVAGWIDARSRASLAAQTFRLQATFAQAALDPVRDAFADLHARPQVRILGRRESRTDREEMTLEISFLASPDMAAEIDRLSQRLSALAPVRQVAWSSSESDHPE